MKKMQRMYFILSYVFFILPPFIWGLVGLYLDNSSREVHVVSLFVNLFVLLIIGLICTIFMKKGILHVPSTIEYKYLLFGLIGNVTIYFYTFQNMLEIQNIITIYLILLVVISVHYFLVSKKITNWELWILMPIFFVIDGLHIFLTGCGFSENSFYCTPNDVNNVILYILYSIIFIFTVGFYGYKIYQYKRYNFFGISNIILIFLVSFFIQDFFDVDEKIIGTLAIALTFLVILDFIVSIVNKNYTSRTFLFYLRTTTILILFLFIGQTGFFKGEANSEMLGLMVVATYASLGITILQSLLHVTEEFKAEPLSEIQLVPCTEELKDIIKIQFGDMQHSHISLDETSYSLVAFHGENMVGFISTSITPLMEPLDTIKEAYLNIIEISPEFQNQGIATKLVHETEQHFKRLGLTQIRGWSSMDRIEAIQLWYSLGYILSPAIIWKEDKQTSIIGYYFMKQL